MGRGKAGPGVQPLQQLGRPCESPHGPMPRQDGDPGSSCGGGRPSFPSRTWEKIPEGSGVSLFRAGTLRGVPTHRRPRV